MRLKVISLNLWHGGLLVDEIVSFLKNEDADVVLLQEVFNSTDSSVERNFRSVEWLKQELAYPYFSFVEAHKYHLDEGVMPQGNAMLSKYSFKSTRLIYMVEGVSSDFEYQHIPEHFAVLPAPLQHAELDIPAGVVNIFNMHGVWDLDGDNYSDRRQRMQGVILRETADKSNVILAGDSNAKSTNQAMRELEPQLKSVFGMDVKTTFNMRRKDKPGYATAAVDLMFVSPNIKVISKEIPDVDISDHLPLVVTLEIP